MSSLHYRADVDGLRALAVLPVVFYHLHWSFFSGGFVGVDIFFVISGFLITSIIYREQLNNQFTMRDFWLRRARRILPAMFVMVLCTIIAGAWLLSPDDYHDLGRSVRYQSVFAANLYFLKETSYFAAEAELQPLLHMWSLAVEEQFYIIYPLLLLAIAKFLPRWRLPILLAIFFASLALSSWYVYQDSAATFFLLHFRAWELLLGGLLVFLPSSQVTTRPIRELASITGLVLVLYAVIRFKHNMVFPGLTALVPVLGAGLIIWAGESSGVNRVLAWRPIVFIGLISYSLYLWHWPFIAYTRYWLMDAFALPHQLLILLVSLVLAWLSYRFIEGPFRKKTVLNSRKKVFIVSLISILTLATLGELLRKFDGFPQRLSDKERVFLEYPKNNNIEKQCRDRTVEQINNNELCRLGNLHPKASILLWGDSHAGVLLPMIDTLGVDVYYSTFAACPPLPEVHWPSLFQCKPYNQAVMDAVKRLEIRHVVLVSYWSRYLLGVESGSSRPLLPTPSGVDRADYFYQQLEAMVIALEKDGVTVWLMDSVPSHVADVPRVLTFMRMRGEDTDLAGRSLDEHLERQAAVLAVFSKLEGRYNNVRRINPTAILCAQDNICRVAKGDEPWYVDSNHLSTAGALLLKPLFTPLVDAVRQENAQSSP